MSSPRIRRALRDVALVVAVGAVAFGVAMLWTAPAPIFSSEHAVPRLVDLELQDAERKVAEFGYHLKVTGTHPHPTTPRGRVVQQDPPPGVVLERGSAIEVLTSAGAPDVVVPDVIGFSAAQARRVLAAAGLEAAQVDSLKGEDEPGIVVSTRPSAGATQQPGSTVGLVVSVNPGLQP
jgi:eukaryotic-like serine/threonine-protein kinase